MTRCEDDYVAGAGPSGEAVAHNVKRLREEQNLSWTRLARALTDSGRPTSAIAIRRVEEGRRRVDADDLVALALALGVTPVTLLMPKVDEADSPAPVTASRESPDAEMTWQWLVAERPLDLRVTTTGGATRADGRQWEQFRSRALPTWRQWVGAHPAQLALRRAEQFVGMALEPDDGATLGWTDPKKFRAMLAGALREQLGELQRLVDGLQAGADVRPGWSDGDR
jgi:transcriptional regulator with XRE-family HTH domain